MKKRKGGIEENIESLMQTVVHIKDNMATKDDIADMATKDDIADMATKDDLANTERRLSQRIDSVSNRLDNELDKRKQIEVRVARLERVR